MYNRFIICDDGFENVYEKGKIIGFKLNVRLGVYYSKPLNDLIRLDVKVDGVEYPPDKIKITLADFTVPLTKIDELEPETVIWNFGQKATVFVGKPGGLEPGVHNIHIHEKIRVLHYPNGILESPADKQLTMPKSAMKRGVITYSYQQEVFEGKINTAGCVAEVAKLGATGIDLHSAQSVPNYPNVPESFFSEWKDILAKYPQITPVSFNSKLDALHRPLPKKEKMQKFDRELMLAKKLGFKMVRIMVAEDTIEDCVRHAEDHGVIIGVEIHGNKTFRSPIHQLIMETILKMNTDYLRFIPDMSTFQFRLTPIMLERYRRMGAHEHIIKYLEDVYSQEKIIDVEKHKEKISKMDANEADFEMLSWTFCSVYGDPDDLKHYIPYSCNIHGKFYEMTEDYKETSIDYENIIPRIIGLGYDGYIVSEYEGQRFLNDAFEVDSIEQVRRQHEMLKRLGCI